MIDKTRRSPRVPSVFLYRNKSKTVRFYILLLSYRVKEVNSVKDKEIIGLLQKRDETAITMIKEQYGLLCRQLAMQILGNEEDADEFTNDALLKLWNSIPPANPEYLKAYFAATVRNLALNRRRAEHSAKRRGEQVPLVLDELAEVAPSGEDVAEDVEQRMLQETIRCFIRRLPDKQQKIFMQRYFYMMQLREIADENGMSENSVTVMLHRLR